MPNNRYNYVHFRKYLLLLFSFFIFLGWIFGSFKKLKLEKKIIIIIIKIIKNPRKPGYRSIIYLRNSFIYAHFIFLLITSFTFNYDSGTSVLVKCPLLKKIMFRGGWNTSASWWQEFTNKGTVNLPEDWLHHWPQLHWRLSSARQK